VRSRVVSVDGHGNATMACPGGVRRLWTYPTLTLTAMLIHAGLRAYSSGDGSSTRADINDTETKLRAAVSKLKAAQAVLASTVAPDPGAEAASPDQKLAARLRKARLAARERLVDLGNKEVELSRMQDLLRTCSLRAASAETESKRAQAQLEDATSQLETTRASQRRTWCVCARVASGSCVLCLPACEG